jgi:hypothetical protein
LPINQTVDHREPVTPLIRAVDPPSPAIVPTPTGRQSALGGADARPLTWWSLLQSCAGQIRSQPLILGVLAIWAVGPLIVLIVHVVGHGGVLTGAYGADAFDQMQYLAWIRDEGAHVLASNLWQIAGTPHDYLQPMYLVSGILWRLGLSIQLALLVWEPVAVLVLFLGFAAYVRHLLPHSCRQQSAALFLALFYQTPVLAVVTWVGHLSALHEGQLVQATFDPYAAISLWGFDHTAITIGLMPVFLIAVERILGAPAGAGRRRGWVALASVAGLLVSWLHPWQGVMLLGIVGAMFVLRTPRRRYLALSWPVAATLAPLLYGVVLSRADPSWRAFQATTIGVGVAPWWALIASFGPLVALAALGMRRPRDDADWMLHLWLLACVLVYFLIPEFPPHALCGVTLPLAVLAIRGWGGAKQRVGGAGRRVAAIGIALIAIVTVPAAVYQANESTDYTSNPIALSAQLLVLTADQAAALNYLDHAPRPGGVLAPWMLSMSVPGFTGRGVFAGHSQWQPPANASIATAFFSSTLKDPTGAVRRAILKRTKATFVIADCGAPRRLPRAIAPIAHPARRFGCVTVYETNRIPDGKTPLVSR